jgi:hypothetical protein
MHPDYYEEQEEDRREEEELGLAEESTIETLPSAQQVVYEEEIAYWQNN